MNELKQLKAKYQEMGAVIERMEKGESEFKPLRDGYSAQSDGKVYMQFTNIHSDWNIMPTEAEATRLGKIFQAVAEQEHLVKFVNGDWVWDKNSWIITLFIRSGVKMVSSWEPSIAAAIFKDETAAERALKLASPNLLAYWKREL